MSIWLIGLRRAPEPESSGESHREYGKRHQALQDGAELEFFTVNICKVLTIVCLGAGMLLPGCGTESIKSSLKSTKEMYYEYINTPAKIDYEHKGNISETKRSLVQQTQLIYLQLQGLERMLEGMDRGPTPESVGMLFSKFPWVSGAAMVDANGEILAQEPVMPLKALEFAPILEKKALSDNPRGLRGMVQDTPLGAEVMLGIPVYHDNEFMGVFVAHFDMRDLARTVGSPENLIILAPEGILWSGELQAQAESLAGEDWSTKARAEASDTIMVGDKEFFWQARYLGVQPIIFVVPKAMPVAEEALSSDEQD